MKSDKVFADRFRYFILGIAFCCLMSISSNISAFNIAQVCMANEGPAHESNISVNGHEKSNPDPPFFKSVNYTASEVSAMNAATGLGLLAATLPITRLYQRLGAYWPLLACGLVSAITTGLLPFAIRTHLYAAIALRFVQGLCFAVDFPTVGALCSNWASLKQTAFFIAVLTSYSAFATSITDSLGGIICASSFGWSFVFFAHSAVGLLVFGLLFAVFYTNRPQDNRFVSSIELERIQRDKSVAQINQHRFVPYKLIFRDLIVYAIWINALFELLATNFLSAYSPYYFRNVLKYGVEETGHFSAISRVTQVPFRILSGYLSDNIKFINEHSKMLIFNSITMFIPGLLFVLVTFLPTHKPLLIVLDFGLVNFFCGAASAGFYKCSQLYGRQYGQFILAMFQLLKSITLFLGPALFALMVQDETSQSEWSRIYWLFAVTLIGANFVFFKFATAEPASYAIDKCVNGEVKETTKAQ